MINQEYEAYGRKFQVLTNFRICCSEQGGPKLRVFAHACAVSALSSVLRKLVLGIEFCLINCID